MDISRLKKAIVKEVDARVQPLAALSARLHANPETAMKEKIASETLVKFLKDNGFKVEAGICEMPTAFRAVYGKGKPIIGFLAEYDALPKLGHACGHNLIATASSAAGIASKIAADQTGGTIVVYGTPGEEGDAGKAQMVEKGAFTELDAAMICHPGGGNQVIEGALACQTLNVEFFGKAAHAAADPEAGINALEAMILSFIGIDALRQHIKSTSRIHGIITDGGEAPNIVPAHTAGSFIVRDTEDDYLDLLKERVLNCFKGAAAATGATLKYDWAGVRYAAMRNNMVIAGLFQQNMLALGNTIPLGDTTGSTGSTDVGNVSRLVPAIQPYVGIAPADVLIHSVDFEKVTGTPEALEIMLGAAKAMAMTAADLLTDPSKLNAAREEWATAK
ncbi:MAG TPA: amidohydrolase [Dehalococcoidales bacterium]|nr:amidohydrolase [Dehalococcoidales bacterium]